MKFFNQTQLECVDFAATQYLANSAPYTITTFLAESNGAPTTTATEPESYEIIAADGNSCTVVGADAAGCMYGTMDCAALLISGKTPEMIASVHTPYIKKRGIKLNIPLDSRTPSFSDASDSAKYNIEQMWSIDFWHEFLDEMAQNHYNAITLWSLNPFGSLVDIPEYPLATLEDVQVTNHCIFQTDLRGMGMSNPQTRSSLVTVKKLTMPEKIDFWRSVMEYAASRNVKVYLFTWNVFVYGTEDTPYGITVDMDNEVTIDYFKCAVRTLVQTYPLLAGIGVTAGEQMNTTNELKEEWLWRTYGEGINLALPEDNDRDFVFIHRVHETSLALAANQFADLHCRFEYSFKYAQAHMFVTTKPHFGDEFFANLKEQGGSTWLTIRNDDFYLLRWADPDFAREFLENIPKDNLEGFYIGSDGYTWGRDHATRDRRLAGRTEMSKQWMMSACFGMLAYRPTFANSLFVSMIEQRFATKQAELLFTAWSNASKGVPLAQCTYYHELDFQYYTEANLSLDSVIDRLHRVPIFRDINEFVRCRATPGGPYISVTDYCNGKTDGITPVENATLILNTMDIAEKAVVQIENPDDNAELAAVLSNIHAFIALGRFFGHKILSAVSFLQYRMAKEPSKKSEAYRLSELAADNWYDYANLMEQQCYPQHMTRMQWVVSPSCFISDTLLDLKIIENEV